MEVILKEDIINLGYKDEVVSVKNGYGRNFLIPQGKAVLATPAAKKMLAEDMKQRTHKLAKLKQEAEELANKLAELKLTIGAKTSSTGKIFGSVTNVQLAEKLQELGHTVDRRVIKFTGEVKMVGSYQAVARIHKDVEATINFEVVAE